jgi:predicted transposase/invertase (TIGR01784 family)
MASPHDALFKAVYGQAEHARGALQAMLPPPLARAIDWPSLALSPGSFIDASLREQRTDLLFSARWSGGLDNAPVYLLFEHQSSLDVEMAYRLLRYMVRIWQMYRDDHPGGHALPMIVSIVLYHGGAAWTVPLAFDATLGVPDEARREGAPYRVQFAYRVDDLGQITDEHLRMRAMTASAKLACLCFKHARDHEQIVELLKGWEGELRDLVAAPHGLDTLEQLVRYIYAVNERCDRRALEAFLDERVTREAKGVSMTVFEQAIQEGKARGLEEGRAQGQEEGRAQGHQLGLEEGKRRTRQELLARQLRIRFPGQVPTDIESRIATASIAQLDLWLDRVLIAPTLDDVFA